MALYRLLYVSESCLPEGSADAIVRSIVDVSRVRNARERINGALLFTGTDFVQVLEGERDAVCALMRDIERDPGHHNVEIVRQGEAAHPLFERWAMAYCGPVTYVHGLIDSVRGASGDLRTRDVQASTLEQFVRSFVLTSASAMSGSR